MNIHIYIHKHPCNNLYVPVSNIDKWYFLWSVAFITDELMPSHWKESWNWFFRLDEVASNVTIAT